MKKKKDLGWLVAAVIAAAFLLVWYFYASTGTEFTLKRDSANTIAGYAGEAAKVVIYPVCSLVWQTVPKGWVKAGWVFFALLPVGLWYIGTERNKKKWMAPAFTIIPLLMAFICFLSGYSSRLDIKPYIGYFDNFVKEFKVSDKQAADIMENGGTGAYLFKDESGLLTEWFKARK